MTPIVERYWKTAIKDKVFLKEIEEADPRNFLPPSDDWDDQAMMAFAMAYYGYLIGSGKSLQVMELKLHTV